MWYRWTRELIPFALVVRGENLKIRTRGSRFLRIFFGQMGPFGGEGLIFNLKPQSFDVLDL